MQSAARLLMLFIFISAPLSVLADEFWQDHSQGWHWYQNQVWLKPEKEQHEMIVMKNTDPIEEMNAVQKTVREAYDKAVLHPSKQNIKHFIEVQNLVSSNSTHFANLWQRVLAENPHLDYSINHPTNQVGTQLHMDLEHQDEARAIHALSKQYGLFFFFRSTCPYCHRFAPIVKEFSEKYGISVIPVSLDGGALPQFPNVKIDNGASQEFHISVVPALFLVNPNTRKVIPISYGLTTESDIAGRIYQIAQMMKSKQLPAGYAS